MKKTESIVYLRDEIGLSFRQISKIVEGKDDSKSILKVYGLYKKYKNNTSQGKVITSSTGITQNISYYVKSKVHEDHNIIISGDLQRERIQLARQLKYLKRDDPRRQEIYMKINEIKLLELLILVYDLIGLAKHDKSRMYLQLIYSIGKKLVCRADRSRDRVKWSRGQIDHLSEEAAAFLYITYFLALYNTPLQHFLDKIKELVFTLMRGRSKEKKIRRLHEIIRERYADVISNIILRIP